MSINLNNFYSPASALPPQKVPDQKTIAIVHRTHSNCIPTNENIDLSSIFTNHVLATNIKYVDLGISHDLSKSKRELSKEQLFAEIREKLSQRKITASSIKTIVYNDGNFNLKKNVLTIICCPPNVRIIKE